MQRETADGQGAVPEGAYTKVEDTARRTFALVDELQQVRVAVQPGRASIFIILQSVRLQHERSERLKVATAEIKNLKP